MRLIAIALVLLSAALVCAQMPAEQNAQKPQAKQPASPRGQAEFTFADGKKVMVDYGRPYIRDPKQPERRRKIMGGEVVPYGQVWRTGANAATSFETQADLVLGNAKIPAGKYTMYTIPNADSWTIIINRETGQWGTKYDQSQDLVRVTAKPTQLPQTVDQFTIAFESRGPIAGVMKLEWENTSVALDFSEANK